MQRRTVATALLLLTFASASGAESPREPSTEELAKAAQNPVADLISVPFQYNANFGYGAGSDRTQHVLNIQPVIPIHVTKDWLLVTRAIFPLVWQPNSTGRDTHFGMGSVSLTAFVSPAPTGGLVWGVGPVVTTPATSYTVGSTDTWGLGPSVVLFDMTGPWVVGILANNVWSVAGATSNNLLLQYFLNYNFGKTGWYVTSSPILTANWEARSGQKWVVPVGGGFGKLVKLGGRLPLNLNVAAFYDAIHPDVGPQWSLRAQAAILLPTSIF